MLLPDHLAQTQQQKEQLMQRTAMVHQLRGKIASDIYARLIAFDYERAIARTMQEANPMGLPDDQVEHEPVPFQLNFAMPAAVASDAAMALLMQLGMIAPEELQGVERVNGSP